MTPERFAALAAAYGGAIDRWPEAERDAAGTHLHAHPEARAALAGAATLDATLAAWTVPGPGAALAARIASATARRRRAGRWLRLWLSGLGTAATLAGGLAAGAVVVAAARPGADPSGALYELRVLGAPLDPGDPPAPGEGAR